MRTTLLLLLILSGFTACAVSQSYPAEDVVTVEGQVSVRGNTPFTAIMLVTDQRNYYILVLDEPADLALRRDLPGHYRVTGRVNAADWNGHPHAHLRPTTMEQLQR